MPSVTQKDIAKALNLSQGLVAQVLSANPRVRATEDTRQRILQAAREMDYRPHTAARSLRSGRTRTVLFATLRPADRNVRYVYATIIETLAESLGQRGYSLQVRSFARSEELLQGLREAKATRSCDMVVLSGDEQAADQQGDALNAIQMPFAVFGRYELAHPDWLQIDFDHEGMMAGAVRHLSDLGHRRIAYFGFDSGARYTRCLREGFIQAARAAVGGAVDDGELIGRVGDCSPSAAEQVLRWLALPAARRPSAMVISTGDRTWMDVEFALAEQGLRVGDGPGEFSLSGIAEDKFPLILGKARVYKELQVNFGALTDALVESLVMPRLQEKAIDTPVLRLLPEMQEAGGRDVAPLRRAASEFIARQAD